MENLENQTTTETTETEVNTEQEISQEVKTISEEDLNKKIQSETDRVRTEYSKKVKQMEEELKELRAKELEAKVSKTLNENGLPSQLAKYINIEGVEDVESYLTEVKEVLTEHINNNALNSSFKPSKHNSNKTIISKEDFNKMSYTEKQKLYATNKELFNQLSI